MLEKTDLAPRLIERDPKLERLEPMNSIRERSRRTGLSRDTVRKCRGSGPCLNQESGIAVEQVDALFGSITISVCGAAIAAIILTATLQRLDALNPRTGWAWTGYIIICAAAHIQLRRLHRRSRLTSDRWKPWALGFTVISFVEGIGWGWSSIGLALAGRSDVKHLVLAHRGRSGGGVDPRVQSLSAGFLAFFVPTVLGALVGGMTSADPIQQAPFRSCWCSSARRALSDSRRTSLSGGRYSCASEPKSWPNDLARQKDIAERASLAKSTFLAAASHDLRQPVHALGLLAGALRGIAMPAEGNCCWTRSKRRPTRWTACSPRCSTFRVSTPASLRCIGALSLSDRCSTRICRDHADEARAKDIALTLKRSGCWSCIPIRFF